MKTPEEEVPPPVPAEEPLPSDAPEPEEESPA